MGRANFLLLGKIIIALLLLTWMATSLSKIFWHLIPQPNLQEADISRSHRAFASVKQEPSPPVDIDILKNIDLFGKEVAPTPVVESVAEPIPEELEATRLNLNLVGSFANEDLKLAYAIIASGKNQNLYKVDEVLVGLNNVKLVRVFTDRIVLSNEGRREVLYMYPEGLPISSTEEDASPELLSSATDMPANGSLASLAPGQRLQKISDVIRFSRKTKDGDMQGFRVLPGRNRAAFEQTGLKTNDVVIAIDGQVLDSLREANNIYREKRDATQASLTVLRDDQELFIDVDLDNINVD